MRYSKATSEPIKLVLAVADDSPVTSVKELPNGVRVSTEYPELTRRYFAEQGIDADVRLSYGASEAKVPDIADCVVEITETGRALRAAGLRIVDTILVSHTEVIANPRSHADPDKRHAMGQLMTLLNGALDARDKVLLKLNVAADRFDAVLAVLPSAKSPTVSELAGGAGLAVESVVDKRTINLLIPALRDAGATDLLEIPISKIVRDDGQQALTSSRRVADRVRRNAHRELRRLGITDGARHRVPVPLRRDRRRYTHDRGRRRRRFRPVCRKLGRDRGRPSSAPHGRT